ncbi:MAG: HAD family hydrolase [Paludibacteraceae bacterium]
MKKLVIFDLDGTLLNTIADLAAATNFALSQCELPTHDTDEYRLFVGNGINKLFERALPEYARDEAHIALVRQHFLTYYAAHNCDLTRPYDGMPELLAHLQVCGLKLAVASNKYQAGTEQLVAHFFPDIRFDAVFGQRENVPTKPDPTIVYDILAATGCTADETIYVGDSGTDMMTAQNAGIEAVGVTWGFRPRTELAALKPAHLADTADETQKIILRRA